MRCCATCHGHRLPRWHRSRFPANGAAPRGGRHLKAKAPGLAGRVGCAGAAASPPPGPGPAAGGWAFGRLRSRASQAKRPHPCKLGRRIHAAHAPAQPTRPATDSFRVRPPRKRKRRSKADRFAPHPRITWIYRVDQGRHLPTAAGIFRGWGGVGLQDRWRHGWRHRAPRDGFTACPAAPHRPAQPSATQSRCCCCCCLCRCRAASPAKATTSPSLQSPAGRGSPATAAASATPGSSHHAGPATAATPATAPPRCNRARPRAARR